MAEEEGKRRGLGRIRGLFAKLKGSGEPGPTKHELVFDLVMTMDRLAGSVDEHADLIGWEPETNTGPLDIPAIAQRVGDDLDEVIDRLCDMEEDLMEELAIYQVAFDSVGLKTEREVPRLEEITSQDEWEELREDLIEDPPDMLIEMQEVLANWPVKGSVAWRD